jgi:hypothetical protein
MVPGVTYNFRLEASNSLNGEKSVVAFEVRTNDSPTGGLLDVFPNYGFAMDTIFEIATKSWEDDPDDYPLEYSIFTYILDIRDQVLLKSRSKKTFTSAFLSPGLIGSQSSSVVYCVAQVFDIYDASAHAQKGVTVVASSGINTVKAQLDTHIQQALGVQNWDRASQVLGAASQMLRSAPDVICLPFAQCNGLNRQPCDGIAASCGECLPGYFGLPAPSAQPCVLVPAPAPVNASSSSASPASVSAATTATATATATATSTSTSTSSSRRSSSSAALALKQQQEQQQYIAHPPSTTRRLNNNPIPGGTGTACSSNADCLSNDCATSTTGQCQQGFKRCPNDCSSNGQCRYYRRDIFSAQACLIEDSTCTPVCECFFTAFGIDCSFSQAQRETREGVIESICSNLELLINRQDADANSLRSTARIISAAVKDRTLVSAQALASCSRVLVDAVARGAEVRAVSDDGTFEALAAGLSALLERDYGRQQVSGATSTHSDYDKLAGALRELVLQRQLEVAIDEAPTVLALKNLRLQTKKAYAAAAAATALVVPLTLMEEQLAVPSASVALEITATQSTEVRSVSTTAVTLLFSHLKNPCMHQTQTSFDLFSSLLFSSPRRANSLSLSLFFLSNALVIAPKN